MALYRMFWGMSRLNFIFEDFSREKVISWWKFKENSAKETTEDFEEISEEHPQLWAVLADKRYCGIGEFTGAVLPKMKN